MTEEIRQSIATLALENRVLLYFCGLFPIMAIRTSWNLLTWNKIYGTKYVPGITQFKKSETNVKFYSALIFWWIFTEDDTRNIRAYKKIGNWISALSVIIFVVFIFILSTIE